MPASPDRRSVLAALAGLPALAGVSWGRTGQERPLTLRLVMTGHSLTDPIPDALSRILAAVGGPGTEPPPIARSTVPGSTLKWRWDLEDPQHEEARNIIADYDVLVMTERVPVRSAIEWEDTEKYARLWFDLALAKGNAGRGAETVFYATWIGIHSGPGNTDSYDMEDERQIPFRERLDLEMTGWQDIADRVNRQRPAGSPKMRVIPGPKIMAAIFDAIAAGTAPGMTAMQDLFRDAIHPNGVGTYPIALAHFAVIYGRDPHTVPTIRGEEGWPTPQQQDWFKDLVWDVLRSYPDSGLA
jgi:hypothetical protein